MPTWPELLTTLLAGEQLAADDTAWAMAQVMDGEATPVQVAGLAVALRAKGETAEEVAGLVTAMLDRAVPLEVPGPLVDTCGTGGDRAHTVNISTMAALVVVGTGAAGVAKHGNRAASSACGSADLLEALGIAVDLPPAAVGECLREAGIAFCFAPTFHPSFRYAATARRELGIATVFNFLGPLTNPAHAGAQAVGVADERMAPVMARVLARRGVSALVFRGFDGLDELSTAAPSRVWSVRRDGAVSESVVDTVELGLPRARISDLHGGDAGENAAATRALLAGERGPIRDAVLVNAAAALVALGPDGGEPLPERLSAGLERAASAVDSGAAAQALGRWVEVSQKLAASAP